MFTPSEQQQAFFNWIETGTGNAILVAVAGSGKTTTLVKGCELMPGRVALVAYNKKIALELQARIEKTEIADCVAGTAHSFGFRAWRNANSARKIEVEKSNSKWFAICDGVRLPGEDYRRNIPADFQGFVKKAVSLAKQDGAGIFWQDDDLTQWNRLVAHYDLEMELADANGGGEALAEKMVDQAIAYSIGALRRGIELAVEIIDFDDMIYMPLLRNCKFDQFDWILVDEAQDTNPVRRELYKRLLAPEGRYVAVGDPCQPAGTMVLTPSGQTPIENLVAGDTVVSFSRNDSAYHKSGREILGVTAKPFTGNLIVAKAGELVSHYTPNHHCWASFAPLANHYVVYLMQRGPYFRVGMCRVANSAGFGPSHRARLEDADNVWILSVHETKTLASVQEILVQVEYGIPGVTFRPVNSEVVLTEEVLDSLWQQLGNTLNKERAEKCLTDFGRELAYPLYSRYSSTHLTRVRTPVVVHACNLVDGMLMLVYQGLAHTNKATDYKPITISREPYNGMVYSLTVEKDHMYVADGIVTHNCQAIYGFTGASANALDLIREEMSCVSLPLTLTFRCPKSVVKLAQTWVSHIEAHESNPEGEVRHTDLDTLLKGASKLLGPKDAILCRNTKPLVSLAFSLIRQGVACHVEGREIGQGLLKLAKRWKSVKTLSTLRDKLEGFKQSEMAKLEKKGNEYGAAAVEDKVETLFALIDSLPPAATVYDLQSKIEGMFSDSPDGRPAQNLTLCTVHKSKGLEWDNVYLLGRGAYMPSRFARQAWQMEQENNLCYVAVTRAKKVLTEVSV